MTICIRCSERPAVACDECRRALALLDRPTGFGGIARHPEAGADCRLCEQGEAALCVECLCQGVLDARADASGPYAGPTPEQFQAAEEKAREDIERVGAINEQLGDGSAVSMYDRRPASRGPSWYRTIGAA